MQPQVDETTNTRHLKMSFMEFLEALARAIDKWKDLPILESVHQHWYLKELEDVDKWSLDMKIEAMMPNMIEVIRNKDDVASKIDLNKTANKTTMRDFNARKASMLN